MMNKNQNKQRNTLDTGEYETKVVSGVDGVVTWSPVLTQDRDGV